MDELKNRVETLEYHVKLLLGMIQPVNRDFDLLVIQKGLTEEEVKDFHELCRELEEEMEEQKAEKFVFHSPLYRQFTAGLNKKLHPKETVQACLNQQIYVELMKKLWMNMK